MNNDFMLYVSLDGYCKKAKEDSAYDVLNVAIKKGYKINGGYLLKNGIGINTKDKIITCLSFDCDFNDNYNMLSLENALNGNY